MSHVLRRLALASLALGAVGFAAGCGGSSSNSSSTSGSGGGNSHMGGTLNLVAQSNPDSIDPAIAYEVESWDYLHMTYDGLMAFDEVSGADSTKVVPDLATAMPKVSDGGKTYTFTLRKGIKFSNGKPVVASDFLTSMERLWKATSPSPYFSDIVGATACTAKPATCNLSQGIVVNNSTGQIVIHLTSPNGELLDQLALPFAYILPPGLPNHDVGTTPIPSTGPYMIQSFAPSTGITLVRNPNFHVWSAAAQPQGYPNKIVWHWGVTAEAEVNGIQDGTYDWSYDNPPADRIGQLSTQYPNQIKVEPSLGTYWFTLNTLKPPFNNKLARQAVNYAVDRASVVKLWGGPGVASPTCQIVPASMPGGSPTYCPYTSGSTTDGQWHGPDMSKAMQLVQKSGTKGEPVTILSETVSPVNQIAVYLEGVLNKLGYKTSLKLLSHGVFFSTAADSRTAQNVAWGDWFPDYPVASNFITILESCATLRLNSTANNNSAFYCDHSVQKMINAAEAKESSQGVSAASGDWNAIDRAITNDAPHIDLLNAKNVYFNSSRLKNWVYSVQWTTLLDQLQVQ
jgi:peptide/nickel transport system substrate-binding protein